MATVPRPEPRRRVVGDGAAPEVAGRRSAEGLDHYRIGRLRRLGRRGQREHLLCRQSSGKIHDLGADEATGKVKWSTPISDKGGAGNSTPTVVNGKVYALSEKGDLACADAVTGNVVWRKSYVDDFEGRPSGFGGYSESVLVDDGKVICVPGSKAAAIVALNAETGEVVWKTEMPDSKPHWVYCSAVKAQVGGIPMYITLLAGGQGGVTAVHAKTGKVLWQYPRSMEDRIPSPTPS